MLGKVLIVLAALAATASAQNCLSFLFYTSATNIVTYTPTNLTSILTNPNFNRQRVTALYMYGFQQGINTASVVQVRDAYIQNGQHNFLLMDCDGSYTALNANSLANEISDVLLEFFNLGYQSWHVVGFSLGAQIAGMTGRHVRRKSLSRHSVPRITGLDPGQLPIGLFADINAGDGNFVDIIHVESVHFGTHGAIGHVNFFVNGGVTQPMCTGAIGVVVATCAHLMAPTYWSETLTSNNPNIFRSTQCDSWDAFVNNQCNSNPTSPMGIGVNFNAQGRYFLRTNLVSPFSLT